MADLGKEIGWDDAIENEGTEPLPEGTYEFTVASMERAHFGGSEKMAPCNVANLDLLIKDKDGRGRHVLSIFVENGAQPEILYEAKPHIGTDVLSNVVKQMREKIAN